MASPTLKYAECLSRAERAYQAVANATTPRMLSDAIQARRDALINLSLGEVAIRDETLNMDELFRSPECIVLAKRYIAELAERYRPVALTSASKPQPSQQQSALPQQSPQQQSAQQQSAQQQLSQPQPSQQSQDDIWPTLSCAAVIVTRRRDIRSQ